MTVEIISWSISTKVWNRTGIELATPGSTVRHASVARHDTDCATRPGICFGSSIEPFHWDGSFEYPQHMFWLRNMKISFPLHTLNKSLDVTYHISSASFSLGDVFLPDSKSCSLLTLCVAVETGVIVGSFSFKYLLPVRGVDGARVRVCSNDKE